MNPGRQPENTTPQGRRKPAWILHFLKLALL